MALTQNIFFDSEGFIIDSDEVLFPLSVLQGNLRVDTFPFIDSIFSVIISMQPFDPALYFPCVEPLLDHLKGFYDYTFTRIERNGQDIFRWQLRDRTDFYDNRKAEQQLRQEKQINGHFTYK